VNQPKTDPGRIAGDMIRGMVWLCLGSLALTVGLLVRTAAGGPLARYAPFVPILGGAYLLILGVEKLVTGFGRARRAGDAETRRHPGRQVAAGVVLLAVALSAPAAAYLHRRPYWNAVSRLASGDGATERLQAIAERHAATMQSGAEGAAALDAWRTAAAAATPLREQFSASLDAARYLAANATGAVKERADIDRRYYALCLEWMDLYDGVTRSLSEESMMEPPETWALTQNAIIERIQALPSPQ